MQIRFCAHQFMWKRQWMDADLVILDRVRELGVTLFEVSLGDDVFFEYGRLHQQARPQLARRS